MTTRKKSDYNKVRTDLNEFLPSYLQTDSNLTLNENLFNRFLTKKELVRAIGLIGKPDPLGYIKNLKEKDKYNQKNQLQPVITAKKGAVKQYMSFEDFLRQAENLGIDVDRFDEWGNTTQFNWAPPIDFDKIVNYQDYYWDSADTEPNYVVVKNLATWSEAREKVAKRTLLSLLENFYIEEIDASTSTIRVQENVSTTHLVGDFLILSDEKNSFEVFEIETITYQNVVNQTVIKLIPVRTKLDDTFKRFVNTRVDVEETASGLKIDGNLSGLLTDGYILSANIGPTSDNPLNGNNHGRMMMVTSSSYDPLDNVTTIKVRETQVATALLSSITEINLIPFIFLLEGEVYKHKNQIPIGDTLLTATLNWPISEIAPLLWRERAEVVGTRETGVATFDTQSFVDVNINFNIVGVRQGDILEIVDGPNRGQFVITNVYEHTLVLYTDFKMFSDYCSYRIFRNVRVEDIESEVAPTPVHGRLWIEKNSDKLKIWDAISSNWKTLITSFSFLTDYIGERNKIDGITSDWSIGNHWIHKDQLSDFTGSVRAQLPIIEYSPYIELSNTSYAKKTWKYRRDNNELFNRSDIHPTTFELLEIKNTDIENPAFQFDSQYSIIFDQSFGNLTTDLIQGVKINLTGFSTNNGVYEVERSEFIQMSHTSRYVTRVFLKEALVTPYDLPEGSEIQPVSTANNDPWLGAYDHWMLENIEILPSSISPEKNPMLDIHIGSYVEESQGGPLLEYETHYGLVDQSFHLINESGHDLVFYFHESLHDLVLYDDYQEGDLRVYVNGVRQYGNFMDLQSPDHPDFVGGIRFINTQLTPKDIIKVELGEYSLQDIGKRAIELPVYTKADSTSIEFDTGLKNRFNLVDFRSTEQTISDLHQYPYFRIFDIFGEAKSFSTNIFAFKESPDSPIHEVLQKRVVRDNVRRDYTFTQSLSDPETNELFCYRDGSDLNGNGLKTIWRVGKNIEQYIPSKIGEKWDIPNQFYYNIHHDIRNDIKLTELFTHFRSIIGEQSAKGITVSNGNNYHLSHDINYGLGGTIKEHNDGFDLLVSALFSNNSNIISLIEFAKEQYLYQLRYVQNQFSKNITSILANYKTGSISDVENFIKENIIDTFENDGKFSQWFGDSTAWNGSEGTGIRNWIATLPNLGIMKKVKPYLISDPVLGIYEVVHHDGHRDRYELSPATIESYYRILENQSDFLKQEIRYETDNFPQNNNGVAFKTGDFVLRTITSTKRRKLYRFSSRAEWENVDLNEFLASLILDIETKLYEVSTDYEYEKFNHEKIDTHPRYEEYRRAQFSQYLVSMGVNAPFLTESSFNQNDPFTWNYYYSPVEYDPSTGMPNFNTAGCWEALYENVYGTPYPHLEPWRLQGYSDIPPWWFELYSDNTGNRVWRGYMWDNIALGIIPEGQLTPQGLIGTGQAYQLDKTYEFFSVNINGTSTLDGIAPDGLLPPYWNSKNTSNPKVRSLYDPNMNQRVTLPNADLDFGHRGYHEWSWEQSADHCYDQLVITFRIQPMRFLNQMFGHEFETVDCLQIDKRTKKVFSHRDTIFHGEYVNDEMPIFKSYGLNQWYVHYNRYLGFDGPTSDFKNLWRGWDNPLSYLTSSIVEKRSFSLENENFELTDQDYEIGLKITSGLKNAWLDSLKATMISIPSKFSKFRDNGLGWTVQFTSSSPITREIPFYAPQNYPIEMKKGDDTFRVFSYSIQGAGLEYPRGYQVISYNQKINTNTPTGFSNNNSMYYADVLIDHSETKEIAIRGFKVRNFQDLIQEINKQLGKSAFAEIHLGDIRITSNKIGTGSSVIITDRGLFTTASHFYSTALQPSVSDFVFNKYFEVMGNTTSVFHKGETIIISDSSQFDGEYTLKDVIYDVDNKVTKIFIVEEIDITSNTVDGTIELKNSLTLPPEWETGTEVFINTTAALPTEFDDEIPFYIIRLNDREFKLSQTPSSDNPIIPTTDSVAPVFVGKLRTTFKALGGGHTEYTWRKHEVDKRVVKRAPQPFLITGMQEVVDFITGYEEYHTDLGFICKSPNAENNDAETGRINDWQFSLEKFIDWAYKLRAIKQQEHLKYRIRFDADGSTVELVGADINWETGTKIILSSAHGYTLPAPFDNPFTQFIPYYIIRNYEDSRRFKIAFSKLDAHKGRYTDFSSIGEGEFFIEIVPTERMLPVHHFTPFDKYLWIEHKEGVLCDVFEGSKLDVLTSQRIYDKNGEPLDKSQILVLRQDKESRISLTIEKMEQLDSNIIGSGIGGIHAFFDGYEHILTFSDYTVAANLIYDSYLGLNTPRFHVDYEKHEGYTMRPNVGGYIYNDGEVIQNMESLTDDMRYYYDTYKSSEKNTTTKLVRKSLGFEESKEYMTDLGINPKSQFIFWKGMIQNKGTNFAVNAFINQSKFNDVKIDECWAYKLAEFGDVKERNYIEMKLKPEDSIRNELRIEFVSPDEDGTDKSFNAVRLTDMGRWWNQPDQLDAMPGKNSFYFNADVTKLERNVDSYRIKEVNGQKYISLDNISDTVLIYYMDTMKAELIYLTPILDFTMFNSRTVRIHNEEFENHVASGGKFTLASMSYHYKAHNPSRLIDKKSKVVVTNVPFWNPVLGQYYHIADSIIDIKQSIDPAVYSTQLTGQSPGTLWTSNKVGTVWMDTTNEGYVPYYDPAIYPDINDRIFNWGKTSDYNKIALYEWTESLVPPSEWESVVQKDIRDKNIPESDKRTGTPLKKLYMNTNAGRPTPPRWVEVTDFVTENTALFLLENTRLGSGNALVYVNGKFDMQLDLTKYSLSDYVNPVVDIPGQKEKPKLHDFIRVVEKGVEIEEGDPILGEGVYKIDTPYSVVQKYNTKTNENYNVYYFWVAKKTNKKSLQGSFTSLYEAEKEITTMPLPYMILDGVRTGDFGYGLIFSGTFDPDGYDLPLRYTKLVVRNLKGIVNEDERYSLRFTRDFTLRDRMEAVGISSPYSPLYLKNRHEEWKIFRENQSQKIDLFLWDKMIEALTGYKLDFEGGIDYNKPVPSLSRVVYDDLYGSDTRYGFGEEQVLFDLEAGMRSLNKIFNDPLFDYGGVDINSFLENNSFDSSIEETVSSLRNIYYTFPTIVVNRIFFVLLNEALVVKKESPDIIKTSWVTIEVEQNVELLPETTIGKIKLGNGGICGVDTPRIDDVTPTPVPPKPSASAYPTPTPTPSTSRTAKPTPTPTSSSKPTPTPTSSVAPTITPTFTPASTPREIWDSRED